jgi:hypothetical protein
MMKFLSQQKNQITITSMRMRMKSIKTKDKLREPNLKDNFLEEDLVNIYQALKIKELLKKIKTTII